MDKETFDYVVSQNSGWAGVIRCLGMKIGAAGYTRVKKMAAAFGTDTSHFVGQSWSKGLTKDDERIAARGRK